MSYSDAIDHLNALGVDAMKSMAPSMHRIEAMCDALDHPERVIPAIHVTGTNGKTSTARIATSLLGATGLSVGTYTSPHLQDVRERIALNGEPVSEEVFGEVFDHIHPYLQQVESDLGEILTYFELLTSMFFLWAVETPVDALVVEVGLGGRWDATNVLPAPVSVITNISLDHTALLGTDRASIAREKAGIIKRDAQVVTAELSPDILRLIKEEARTTGAALLIAFERDFHVVENNLALGGRYLTLESTHKRYEELFLPLHGSHQAVNAVTALQAVTSFLPASDLEQDLVAEGMSLVEVPGRVETIQGVVLDVAHNPEGMSAFVTTLLEAFAFDEVVVVLGVLADKDHKGMLTELSRLNCRIIATRPENVRSIAPSELEAAAAELDLACEVVGSVTDALAAARRSEGDGTLVCVTGSHYVVGEARTFLLPSGTSNDEEAHDGRHTADFHHGEA